MRAKHCTRMRSPGFSITDGEYCFLYFHFFIPLQPTWVKLRMKVWPPGVVGVDWHRVKSSVLTHSPMIRYPCAHYPCLPKFMWIWPWHALPSCGSCGLHFETTFMPGTSTLVLRVMSRAASIPNNALLLLLDRRAVRNSSYHNTSLPLDRTIE